MRLRRFRSKKAAKGPEIASPFSELGRWIPPDRLLLDPGAMSVYECDAFPIQRQLPGAVTLCASREEVIQVVRWCHSRRVPFVPRGAGTSLSGGATPSPGCVVIDVNRMRSILRIDVEDRYAVVEPGIFNSQVTEATAPYGLQYAPDPSSQKACTIGGNVAQNAGGPHCLKHGVTRDHVLGLEVVLPDGMPVRMGGPSAGGVGHDLVGLFVGTEGTFGVVTEVTVKLIPMPQAVRTYLAIFDKMSLATRTVADITRKGILPVALEILDQRTIRAVEASVFAAGYPQNAAAVLLVEIDGLEAGMDAEEERIRATALENHAMEFRAARDHEERERLWKGRKSAYGAMGRINTDLHVLDGVVPRTRLESALGAFEAIAARYGLTLCNVFHAGDGNVHPTISYDGRDPLELERVLAASREIAAACVGVGGTISGEHGIGLEKKDLMPLLYSPTEIEFLRALRHVVDPDEISNRGKIFPDVETEGPAAPSENSARDSAMDGARTPAPRERTESSEGGSRDALPSRGSP